MKIFFFKLSKLFFILFLFSPVTYATPSGQNCGCHLSQTTGVCATKLTVLAGAATLFTCKSLFKEKSWPCYVLGGSILAGAFMTSFLEYNSEEKTPPASSLLSQSPAVAKKKLFCPYNILEYLLYGPNYSGCFHNLTPSSRLTSLENLEEALGRLNK